MVPAMRALALALLCALPACAGEEAGHPPVARIACTTSNSNVNCFLLLDDNFNTDVMLDGSKSADLLDDPQGRQPLRFRWELPEGRYRLTAGTLDGPMITVRGQGDLPMAVRLTVTDPSGLSASAERVIGISVRAPQP